MLLFVLIQTLFVSSVPSRPVTPEAPATLSERFQPPAGFERTSGPDGSFAPWLRSLPLLPKDSPVLLHTGEPKYRQDVHAAVVDISVGKKDLQQCADAVMRLRAEYLSANGQADAIAFNFTNGFKAEWRRWRTGERIKVVGNTCSWVKSAAVNNSHDELMRYLEKVFTYAGTLSLEHELKPCANSPIAPGDVFIHGGSPGHAMLVVDVAIHPDGRQAFLLAQSYMPAQQIHLVKNLRKPTLGAWFVLNDGEKLYTPEWTFSWSERRRW